MCVHVCTVFFCHCVAVEGDICHPGTDGPAAERRGERAGERVAIESDKQDTFYGILYMYVYICFNPSNQDTLINRTLFMKYYTRTCVCIYMFSNPLIRTP